MDFYSNMPRENFSKEDLNRNNFNYMDEKKIEQFTIQQIEMYIQQQYQINIPAIIFEYSSSKPGLDFSGWDSEDLEEFFSNFGEFESLEVCGRTCFIIFKNFFDANTSREFLQNPSNFKENEKSSFTAKWYKPEEEKDFPEDFKARISKCIQKYNENAIKFFNNLSLNFPQQSNFGNFNQNWNSNQMPGNNRMTPGNKGLIQDNNINYINNIQNNSNINLNMSSSGNNLNTSNANNNIPNGKNKQNFNIHYNGMNMNNNFMNSNNNNNLNKNNSFKRKNSFNSNGEEMKTHNQQSGKYTCRYELQIENDKDFQVARRLIGAKGCNMKRIVDICNKNADGSQSKESVKLRLRGRGSGYKEGPMNRESDEPLHLCISSKILEKYQKACNEVQELVSSVYEDYKKYCERINKPIVSCLAIRREEGISTRKNGNGN